MEKAGSLEPEKVVKAMSEIEIEVPHGKLSVVASSNHARNGTLIAKVNDKAGFDVIKVTEPVDPIAGCSL